MQFLRLQEVQCDESMLSLARYRQLYTCDPFWAAAAKAALQRCAAVDGDCLAGDEDVSLDERDDGVGAGFGCGDASEWRGLSQSFAAGLVGVFAQAPRSQRPSMKPGAMVLIRISGPRTRARDLVITLTPALLAA